MLKMKNRNVIPEIRAGRSACPYQQATPPLPLTVLRTTEILKGFRMQICFPFHDVNEWTPAWRYAPNQATPKEATDFMEAVEKVMHWIDTNI